METITPTRSLDRRGKTITTFAVFDATIAMESLASDDVLELITDDYEPFEHDVAAWCRAAGHALLENEHYLDGRRFLIEKGPRPAKETRLAMVVTPAGLEELLTPLGFALGAALEGIEVHLFFQGPAVRVLSRRYRPKLSGWMRPFSRFAAAAMARSGHVPAQEKIAQLRLLGAKIYMCGPSMDHFKVAKGDLVYDDLPLIEYLTFMEIMAGSDIHLYG